MKQKFTFLCHSFRAQILERICGMSLFASFSVCTVITGIVLNVTVLSLPQAVHVK